MSSQVQPPRTHHATGTRVAIILLALVVASGVFVATHWSHHSSPRGGATTSAAESTTVRVGSFNMLGYSHTTAGGRTRFADGIQRTVWATKIIANNNLQVIGLQEFQAPQYRKFVSIEGSTFGIYPAMTMGKGPVQNSIVWRTDQWELVEKHTMKVPYFHGNLMPMPYVLLRNRTTGQEMWLYNSHNPADVRGDATQYRARAVALEIDLMHRLRTAYPTIPVLNVGDKNDRSPYICPMMANAQMHPSSGGAIVDGQCLPKRPMYADWVTGNDLVSFANHHALFTPLVQKTTDHHVLYADATLSSSVTPDQEHVVLINIEGLRGPAIHSRITPMPTLKSMMRGGVATGDARTAYESVNPVANTVSMLTARTASKRYGGTGVATTSGTVAKAAGTYVPSAFDVVHDAGLRTGFWTSNRAVWRVVTASWNGTGGAADTNGVDNGRNKISAQALTTTDRAAMNGLSNDLKSHGTVLSVAVLSAPAKVARRFGYASDAYRRSLVALDGYLAQLLRTIHADPRLDGHTTVVITSDHGATSATAAVAANPHAYRIPIIAWGASVAGGKSLYPLNPQLADPHSLRVGYAHGGTPRQPARIGFLANYATGLLDLGPVGTLDARQSLRTAG
ncbi:alkaline phosphatase family protein [Nocardioides montaniterrae]